MMTDAQVAARVCVASIVPSASSTATYSGLPVRRAPTHPLLHGHQVTRDDLWRIGPGGGGAGAARSIGPPAASGSQ